jgi:hypothetical protein
VAWTGFAVSFAGDGLVLASLGFSASFTVAQARLLPGRDPVAVTAVQFLAAALTALPVAAATEGTPPAAAVLTGIALSSLPLLRAGHHRGGGVRGRSRPRRRRRRRPGTAGRSHRLGRPLPSQV